MAWLQKLIDLFYNDDGLILENIYIFITYGIICIGLTLAINKFLNNHLKRRYEKVCDEKDALKEENEALNKEIKALKEIYKKYDEKPRLMMGTNEDFPCQSAETLSDEMKKRAIKNKKN